VEEIIPIGFFQYYDTDKAPLGEWSNEPTGTAGIDFLIGEEIFLNKGYGVKLLKIIIEEIKLKGFHKYIIADPDQRNAASVKVLEKCGFKLTTNGLFKLKIDDL
jgi:RimJ/RimL family protein N-acetyltransferase